MKTLIETAIFTKKSANIWSEEERLDFITFLAINPTAGDVIPHSEGARKIRWAIKGAGKRGGARIIYFNADANGVIYLLDIYVKNEQENISSKEIKKMRIKK